MCCGRSGVSLYAIRLSQLNIGPPLLNLYGLYGLCSLRGLCSLQGLYQTSQLNATPFKSLRLPTAKLQAYYALLNSPTYPLLAQRIQQLTIYRQFRLYRKCCQCNGARAYYLLNTAVCCHILPHPIIGSPTTSALAASFIYLFILVLAAPFPSPRLSIFIRQ